MKCDIFEGNATCECCEGTKNWNYCPFDGTKLKKHRRIKEYSLDKLLKLRIIDEDGLICIVRNGWIYQGFVGRIVAIKNDESTNEIDYYTITDAFEGQKWMQLEANDGVKRMDYGEANVYMNSNIRKWLNEEFYNGFSCDMQDIIRKIPTITSNGRGNSDHLKDRITIPSVSEICGDTKWFDHETRISNFDKHDGSPLTIRKHIKSIGWYWTRTRNSNNTSDVWYVSVGGNVYYDSCGDSDGCVVPVFRVGC